MFCADACALLLADFGDLFMISLGLWGSVGPLTSPETTFGEHLGQSPSLQEHMLAQLSMQRSLALPGPLDQELR